MKMTKSAPASLSRYRELLVRFVLPFRGRMALLVVLLISTIGLQLLNPLILRRFIDTALARSSFGDTTTIAVVYTLVALLSQVVGIAEAYVAADVAWRATNRLRSAVAHHCLSHDMAFHSEHLPGELIERIDGDISTLANFFSRFVISILGNMLMLVGILIVLVSVDWRIGVSVTVYTLLALLVLSHLRGVAQPFWEAARQSSADLFGFIEERLSGAEDIRANGAMAYVLNRLGHLLHVRVRKERAATTMGGAVFALTFLLAVLGTIVAFGLSAYLFRARTLSIGTAYLVYNYAWLLWQPLMQIQGQLNDAQLATAGMQRVWRLLDTTPTIQDGPGADLPGGASAIEFDHVSFGYGAESRMLSDISLVVAPGAVLGVLGRTGSGKSTLARLVFRLYDPDQGVVRLGGVDVRRLHLEKLRQRVGMVTQDVQLFHGTVRDNLTFFDEHVDDQVIMAALLQLGLGQWYDALPRGLDTLIGAGGWGLSAGEAQVLAVARVFLRDPSVVILDEASSRLDPATERIVEQALDKLLRGRTCIVIAHRLATVERADEIVVLEGGLIREYGPRRRLANDTRSRFYALLHADRPEGLT